VCLGAALSLSNASNVVPFSSSKCGEIPVPYFSVLNNIATSESPTRGLAPESLKRAAGFILRQENSHSRAVTGMQVINNIGGSAGCTVQYVSQGSQPIPVSGSFLS